MTAAVRSLLTHFEHLSEAEKRDAASEILRRARDWDSPPLSDDELTAIADETFIELDRREANS